MNVWTPSLPVVCLETNRAKWEKERKEHEKHLQPFGIGFS